MGCEEHPGEESGQAEREWFVHLEVLSADPKMPAFLGNLEGVKGKNGRFGRQKEKYYTPARRPQSRRHLAPRQRRWRLSTCFHG
ncbi:hypothetical protein DSQ47_04825 [Salmonella enterica]|nr:hypothetical protein [Salmonella enterica]